MSYGLNVKSALNTIQVDEQFIGIRLIQQGTLTPVVDNSVVLTMPQVFSSPPLVLIRPSAYGRYVGAAYYRGPVAGFSSLDTMAFVGRNNQSFEYAIFAIERTAIDDGSTHGLRVWNSSNQLTFSSSHTRARITHLYNFTSFPECLSSVPSYSVSGYSSMPWVVANCLYAQVMNGEYESVFKGFVVGFDSPSVMRVGYADAQTSGTNWPRLGCSGSGVARAPYPFQIALAKINEGAV